MFGDYCTCHRNPVTVTLGGGLGGTGLRLLPNTVLGGAVSTRAQNVFLGSTSALIGDSVGQRFDIALGNQADFSLTQLGFNTFAGGALGGMRPLELNITGLNTGRNNYVSIYNGLQTRMSSGDIGQVQLRYGVNAGVGTAVRGVIQQGVGAGADGVRKVVGQ